MHLRKKLINFLNRFSGKWKILLISLPSAISRISANRYHFVGQADFRNTGTSLLRFPCKRNPLTGGTGEIPG